MDFIVFYQGFSAVTGYHAVTVFEIVQALAVGAWIIVAGFKLVNFLNK